MKVLFVSGSPRKGNTEFMLNKLMEFINADKELVLLRNKNIEHCKGCLNCGKSNECVINDDMRELYSKLINADFIVLGTPNYFDNVPGLLKDFIDRTNPFYETDTLKDKPLIALIVGGGKIENSKRVLDAINYFVKAHKIKLVDSLVFRGLKADEVEKNKEAIDELKKLVEKIK